MSITLTVTQAHILRRATSVYVRYGIAADTECEVYLLAKAVIDRDTKVYFLYGEYLCGLVKLSTLRKEFRFLVDSLRRFDSFWIQNDMVEG